MWEALNTKSEYGGSSHNGHSRKRTALLCPPSQNTNSVFLHSRDRPAPDTSFASRELPVYEVGLGKKK